MEGAHLARRFFGALTARRPGPDDQAWAVSFLKTGERDLWRRMDAADQAHALRVAHTTIDELGDKAAPPVIAAALLHDIGKLEANLGTFGRVAATVLAKLGVRAGAVGNYWRHNELGALMLAAAESDPLTIAWAREHELPPRHWTIDPDIASALHRADDE